MKNETVKAGMKIGATVGGLVFVVFGIMPGFYFGSYGTLILLQKLMGGTVEPTPRGTRGSSDGNRGRYRVRGRIKHRGRRAPRNASGICRVRAFGGAGETGSRGKSVISIADCGM